jgi:hypothetical protein
MDTPRYFSSPPGAILGHDIRPLDHGMERNPGSETAMRDDGDEAQMVVTRRRDRGSTPLKVAAV